MRFLKTFLSFYIKDLAEARAQANPLITNNFYLPRPLQKPNEINHLYCPRAEPIFVSDFNGLRTILHLES
jgi:hypothetical protein